MYQKWATIQLKGFGVPTWLRAFRDLQFSPDRIKILHGFPFLESTLGVLGRCLADFQLLQHHCEAKIQAAARSTPRTSSRGHQLVSPRGTIVVVLRLEAPR